MLGITSRFSKRGDLGPLFIAGPDGWMHPINLPHDGRRKFWHRNLGTAGRMVVAFRQEAD